MLHFLHDNPLMLLFLVAAVGYPLGRIRIAGTGLGVAAVLFAGLAVGALDPAARLPEEFTQLGLVLFVYTLGLSSAPAFLSALRRNGVRDNLLTGGVLVGAGAVAAGLHGLLSLRPTQTAGLFAGALTNTPALAAVIEHIRRDAPADQAELLLGDPVAAYSAAYPVGVIGMIAALVLARRLWRVDFADEARRLRSLGVGGAELVNRTLRVTRPEAADAPIAAIARGHDWHVVFGRVEHAGAVSLADGATRFALGDRVSVIGPPDEVARVADFLGEIRPEPLDTDGGGFEYRLVFVSSPEVAGRTLKELDIRHRLGALVTRVRRGDSEIAGLGRTVLEPGDQVRVIAHRDHMEEVRRFFGDSYRGVGEIDILTFNLGLAAGLVLGLVPLPLPGGDTLRLGLASGPLLAALVLGAAGRTGPLVWTLPYGANLTLRQVGMVLFLAGVGTRGGGAFAALLGSAGGAALIAGGAAVTLSAALAMLAIGRRLGIPLSLLSGMLGGMQTQPAVLGFAGEQAGNDLPALGYASVFPTATLVKILLAQLLLALPR